jgi:hypothetical protein
MIENADFDYGNDSLRRRAQRLTLSCPQFVEKLLVCVCAGEREREREREKREREKEEREREERERERERREREERERESARVCVFWIIILYRGRQDETVMLQHMRHIKASLS